MIHFACAVWSVLLCGEGAPLYKGFKFCVMVIFRQRETEGEKAYVRHWSNFKEKRRLSGMVY